MDHCALCWKQETGYIVHTWTCGCFMSFIIERSLVSAACREPIGLLHRDGERHRPGGGVPGGRCRQVGRGRGGRQVTVRFGHRQPGWGRGRLLQHPGRRLPPGARGHVTGDAASVRAPHLLCQPEELPWVQAHTDPAHLPRWARCSPRQAPSLHILEVQTPPP